MPPSLDYILLCLNKVRKVIPVLGKRGVGAKPPSLDYILLCWKKVKLA